MISLLKIPENTGEIMILILMQEDINSMQSFYFSKLKNLLKKTSSIKCETNQQLK